MSEQDQELKRVSARIGQAIAGFYEDRLASPDGTFHAEELRQWVIEQCGVISPGSADRILRAMRAKGIVAYEVVSRSQSFYRALPIAPPRPPGPIGEQLSLLEGL